MKFDNTHRDAWRQKNVAHTNAKNRFYGARLKAEVVSVYGGRCECCREKRLGFLTIDHVAGGGRRQRAVEPQGSGRFYRKLRDAGCPEGYRVLCFNCNFGTWLGKGTCIHKLKGEYACMSSAQVLRTESPKKGLSHEV